MSTCPAVVLWVADATYPVYLFIATVANSVNSMRTIGFSKVTGNQLVIVDSNMQINYGAIMIYFIYLCSYLKQRL